MMARLMMAFTAIRNMILHGERQEKHVVTYQVDTNDPDIVTNVFSMFVEDVEPRKGPKCKEHGPNGNGDVN